MSNIINTDPKLAALLGGASLFTGLIDPQGLLAEGRLIKLCFNLENSFWSARYAFGTSEEFVITGIFRESLNPVLDAIKLPLPDGKYDNVQLKPAENLCEALGPLSGIPVRLRRSLSPAGLTAGKEGKIDRPSLESFANLVANALFWGVELHQKEEPMKGFSKYTISFESENNHDVRRILLTMTCPLDEGEISVDSDATVYGLGNKRVVLRKNLGMARMATVKCTINRNGQKIPSLKAAFDLYDAIPVLYEKERHKTISMGRPKSKP